MGMPRVSHIVTGFKGWKEAGYPVEPPPEKK
jgi:3-mercaptopyruvate sulfurtransferase SseA